MKRVLSFRTLRFQNEYFLFLLPLFFVLHGYTDNYDEIPAMDAFLLILKYFSWIAIIGFSLSLVFNSVRKAAVFTLILFAYYFFFGATHDWLKEMMGHSFFVSYAFILPFSTVGFILLFMYIKRVHRVFRQLIQYLNAVLLILVSVDVVLLTLKLAEAQTPGSVKIPAINQHIPVRPDCNTRTGEDIHLIITDEYSGTVSLKEALQFDNTAFEDSLRHRGFHVVDRSQSNYNYTVASMASLFQMEYLPELANKPEEEIYRLGKALINRNNVSEFLNYKGYTIRNFSIFDFAGHPPFAEPYFPQNINLISGNTFLSRIKSDIGYHAALTFRIHSELEKVKASLRWEAEAESRKMDSVLKEVVAPHQAPRFFYTHLMMPHAPYLLDKEENLIRLEQNLFPHKKRTERELYLGYLQYANKKLLQFIDAIRKASARPPVILLMSDHGLRRDWVPTPHHFRNINAVFIPDSNSRGAFYSGISNVNQFRVLLNLKFDQELPLLPDSSILLDGKQPR